MGPPSVPRGRADRGGQSQPASIERRLLPRLTEAIEARHFSPRTEKAYRGWVRRFLQFHVPCRGQGDPPRCDAGHRCRRCAPAR
ncbi:MAG: hypothetical protein DMF49_08875 [Acidobacteria bacterium]|nr:MAG: hypothetical protein DMF49_08875 [Acidobacteriota bacterium]